MTICARARRTLTYLTEDYLTEKRAPADISRMGALTIIIRGGVSAAETITLWITCALLWIERGLSARSRLCRWRDCRQAGRQKQTGARRRPSMTSILRLAYLSLLSPTTITL